MPFKDILGHDKEIDILKKALSQDRVPHSFLFAGPEGCGKRLTAFSLAKSLNCSLSGSAGDFCGACRNCTDIDNLSYADVFLIEPRESESKGGAVDHASGVIKIDAVRGIQKRLSYRSISGGKKVCIVDGAERMNEEAQNAFLKTLEEPPADSVIILIAGNSGTILPTIISRCQRINFRPLPRDIIVGIIMQRAGLDEKTASLIASLSEGSVGKALKWDTEELLKHREKCIEVLSAISLSDIEGLFRSAEEVSKGESPVESLEFFKIWFRDMAVLGENADDLVINADLLSVLVQHAKKQTFERLMSAFKNIHDAQTSIMPPRYANRQLAMENLFMQLAR